MNVRTLFLLWIIMLMVSAAQAQDNSPIDPSLAVDRLLRARELAPSNPDRADRDLETLMDRVEDDRVRWLIAFTRGVIALREGKHEHGLEMFTLARAVAVNDTQRRDSAYNLGHAHAAISLGTDTDLDPSEGIAKRISRLEQAADAFLASARFDPDHKDSVQNLERVRRMIQELRNQLQELQNQQDEQQKQDEEQESSDASDQDNNSEQPEDTRPEDNEEPSSEDLQKLADEQREESQRNESPQDQQRDDAPDRQRELSEQTEQAQKQSGEQNEISSALQEAREAQQRAQDALERGDFDTASLAQREAADHLDRAAQATRQQERESQENQPQPDPSQAQTEGDERAEQPDIDDLAEALLNQEQELRDQREEYRSTGRPVRVEEDW